MLWCTCNKNCSTLTNSQLHAHLNVPLLHSFFQLVQTQGQVLIIWEQFNFYIDHWLGVLSTSAYFETCFG
jgi:hypothetical protein